ncbi:isoprenyl transferase [Pannonibacter carbonis]|uniref:isoprenyl transferase n=1 Tax=Pannonibacter carbonis TaxID=2067569 RepID=UPI000D0EEAF9|nr:isoprenyl transferase [Pannonibacter carbonis]
MTTSPDSGLLKPGQIPREAAKRHGVPRHVAIIMDGNGRWANARGLPRTEGHRQGLDALRGAIRHAGQRGIDFVTVYSFSSENWSRPPTEVSFLMGLLRRFVQRDLSELHQANIRVRVIGARAGLEPGICALLDEAEALTRANTGMTLVVAFNYGGRDEILRAARQLAEAAAAGQLDPASLSEQDISSRLDTSDIPDPDLIIRTSGEQRLSNFLLWQAAYAEFVFSPVMWPDFDAAAFDAALDAFSARERRFGAVSAGGG